MLSLRGYKSFVQSPVQVNKNKINISPYSVAGAVERAAKFVPGALCLAQAVAAQRLLARFGYITTMRIGVKSDNRNSLKAHAWLIVEDQIVLGGLDPHLAEYKVITDMRSATI